MFRRNIYPLSRSKWIEQFYPRILKIRDIPRHHRQLVAMGGGGELTVERRDTCSLFVPCSHQLPPNMGGAGVEAEDAAFHTLAKVGEPGLQGGLPLPARQTLDATAQLADGDRAQVKFRLVIPQPRDDQGIRFGLGEFAEDIGIHEVAHRDMGLVKSFALGGTSNGNGHARR